jgi:hypothetical protein
MGAGTNAAGRLAVDHISTGNSPSNLVAPQNEQCPAASVSGAGRWWPWASAGDVAAADPAVGLGPQVPIELPEDPNPDAVDPNIWCGSQNDCGGWQRRHP